MSGMIKPLDTPRWINIALIPLVNLLAAFFISSILVLIIGENPIEVWKILVYGAFGYDQAIGYTLYYTTNFIFTGLAVAIAFHCGLFNIGGEGQLYIAGLGLTIVCLAMSGQPWFLVLPLAMIAAIVFGGVWGAIPGWLQAKRGSHIVITTIMFNFIAAALMSYLIVDVFTPPGHPNAESATFDIATRIPQLFKLFSFFNIEIAKSPMNLSLLIALSAAFLVWIYIWNTRWGYELRVVGKSEHAAVYGGISPSKNIIICMFIAGALAGLATINIIMGNQFRLVQNFTGGYGFVGIAVAFMGRHHPFGICLAALLFGALYQGGTELDFEIPTINKDLVVVIQGLVILFCGALEHFFRPQIENFFRKIQSSKGIKINQTT